MGAVEQIEPRADQEPDGSCRGLGGPRGEDVIAPALQPRAAVLARDVETPGPLADLEMIGKTVAAAGDGQARVEAEQRLEALRRPAPPDDARRGQQVVDDERDRGEGPRVRGIVERPARTLLEHRYRHGPAEELRAMGLCGDVPRDLANVALREWRSAPPPVLLEQGHFDALRGQAPSGQ